METQFEIIRQADNNYLFRQKPPQSVQLFQLKSAEESKGELLAHTDLAEFELKLAACEARPFFLVQTATDKLVIGERTLPVAGMNNFRDMGGYVAYQGKRVKWGKLYRSDHLYNLKEEGVAYLSRLGIQTIIDYRSPNEVAKYPNRTINGEEKTYQLDPNAHTAELAAQFTSDKHDEDRNLVNKIIEQKAQGKLNNRYDIVMAQYRNFVEKPECQVVFAQMLRLAANPENAPLVQHCRGGKDRTGFGAMLLLGVLGVSKADIIDDYMLTHYNRLARNQEKMAVYCTFTQDQEVLDYLLSLIDTQPEFIEHSLNIIEAEYGSIEQYVQNVLGISQAEIDRLREGYLV